MMLSFHWIIVAIIVVNGCEDDTLLTPNMMVGDTNGNELSIMLDGSYSTYWRANNDGTEYVYFWFSGEVQVKWIFVQRYSNYATYVRVYDGTTNIAWQYFGDSTEVYDSVTIRFDDVYTDYLRFEFSYTSQVRISRLEVHGCYNTSTPTTSPTTEVPSSVPTSFPTVSPSLAPVTAVPSEKPTTRPTNAPSVSPSTANPSLYPSNAPSFSPTYLPSVGTVIPSASPTDTPSIMMPTNHPSVAPSSSPTLEPTVAILSPLPSISPTLSPTEPPTVFSTASGGFQNITLGEIEILLVVICCLCGVLLVSFLRYRRAILANEVLNNTAGEARYLDRTGFCVEDYMMETRETRNMGGIEEKQTLDAGCDAGDRVKQINKTRHFVGEGGRQEAKDHHVVTEIRNIGGENNRQEAKDHNVDIRFALNKFSSDNCEMSNKEGDLEIGKTREAHNIGGIEVKQTSDAGCDVDDRIKQTNKTRRFVGEDSRQEAKDHHIATETRNICGENSRQEAKGHNVDVRFALNKFSSDNCEMSNKDDLEIGTHESAL